MKWLKAVIVRSSESDGKLRFDSRPEGGKFVCRPCFWKLNENTLQSMLGVHFENISPFSVNFAQNLESDALGPETVDS